MKSFFAALVRGHRVCLLTALRRHGRRQQC